MDLVPGSGTFMWPWVGRERKREKGRKEGRGEKERDKDKKKEGKERERREGGGRKPFQGKRSDCVLTSWAQKTQVHTDPHFNQFSSSECTISQQRKS